MFAVWVSVFDWVAEVSVLGVVEVVALWSDGVVCELALLLFTSEPVALWLLLAAGAVDVSVVLEVVLDCWLDVSVELVAEPGLLLTAELPGFAS